MSDPTEQPKKLPIKQQRFVDAYVGEARANAAKAARLAGYSEATARQQGQRLLTNVDIQAAISERVSEYAMSPEEVLAEYADIARNASIVPLLKLGAGRPAFELADEKGEAKPEMRFVKSVKVTEGNNPSVAVELHDRVTALDRLAKYHGLAVERHEVSGPDGGPVVIRNIEVVPPK